MPNEIAIANIETGEVIQRPMTEEELETDKINRAYYFELEQKEKAESESKASAREAILDRLGITAEEAQLLLGGN